MSLFKKLFSADADSLRRKADALFDAGDFGPAKLAYEKALAASPEDARPQLVERVRGCTNGIARERIEEAQAYLRQGAIELAEQELAGALEVAEDDNLRQQAQALLDGLEAGHAQAQATSEEMSDEERIAILMGQWEEAQADEYERYGDALLEALLALHAERYEDARAQLETLLDSAETPRYLWLEVGRARLLTDDDEGGRQALEHFLGSLDDGEANEAKVAVNLTLARLADDGGEFEQAMKRFEAAVHAVPDDYRPYLAMGAFLRDKDHTEEALEVLRTALTLSASSATDWRLLEELGLASEQAGKPGDAVSFLEQVIEFFTSRQVMDFPPATATSLARLYEAEGRLDRAADMYRALSQGSDGANHAVYHYEAGRLLTALGLQGDARRMLTRAEALLGDDDSDLRTKIASLLQP
ncbi:MAG: tetratricopeptide repeat protein [Deltaproteobacteria bacterium]|jgi:tetratricopeptide (TPR) repeat protein|nr:tetratricopeptide repeat protein [Deltaproteobacteria bacterium]